MLEKYGVLKGRPIRGVPGRGTNPHYQVHLVDDSTEYRIAINVKSQMSPSEVEFIVDEDFRHPITEGLIERSLGFTELASTPTSGALDFIRGNLFDRTKMRPLPFNVDGPDNDLNDAVDRHIQAAIQEEQAFICAFGERWGPETVRDKIFGFVPGNGIHDIHMNQGNSSRFVKDDGVWQDGGLLIFLPSVQRWVAIFLKFQSQSWHTDDVSGHRIDTPAIPGGVVVPPTTGPGHPPSPGEPDLTVKIVAALVNPGGGDQGSESVTILNTTDTDINLGGWAIANKAKERYTLTGVIRSGQALQFVLPVQVPLSNQGGIITLLNEQELKVHGVSYTKAQASREGWTLTF